MLGAGGGQPQHHRVPLLRGCPGHRKETKIAVSSSFEISLNGGRYATLFQPEMGQSHFLLRLTVVAWCDNAVMRERQCRYCQKSVQTSKFRPRQTVCSETGCQRQRRADYHRE